MVVRSDGRVLTSVGIDDARQGPPPETEQTAEGLAHRSGASSGGGKDTAPALRDLQESGEQVDRW